MKMKYLILLLSAVLLAATLCISVSAEGETADTALDASVTDIMDTYTENEGYHTVVTRIWEYVAARKTELLGILGDCAIFISAMVIKRKNDRKTKKMSEDIASARTDIGTTLGEQSSVVGAVNGLIEGYNSLAEGYREIKSSYDSYEEREDARDRLIGALTAQNTAILEILTTVYANSKNLPQGVKDIVNIRYANCLKRLECDEELRSVVDGVRSGICNERGGEKGGETEEAEA